MAKEVLYLYFGTQCPGTYLAEQAKKQLTCCKFPIELSTS